MQTKTTHHSSIIKWKDYASMFKLPSLLTSIFCFMSMLIITTTANAQGSTTVCTPCSAGDVQILNARLVDENGIPLTSSYGCGEEVYVRVNINVNRNEFYGFLVVGTLTIDDIERIIGDCFAQTYPKTTSNFDIPTGLTWDCADAGSTISLTDVFSAWGIQAPGAGEDYGVCSYYNFESDLFYCDDLVQSPPSSKCKYYDGDEITFIPPDNPCSLSVNCPENNDLGLFDCGEGPSEEIYTSLADYGISVTNQCGTIDWSFEDGQPSDCEKGFRTVTRTIIIRDMEGETVLASTTCEFTYTIATGDLELVDENVDVSTLNETEINNCLSEGLDFDASTFESAIAALYSENCGGAITVQFTGRTEEPVTNNNCQWSVNYLFDVSDECGNTLLVSVTRSGGDKTAPALKNNGTTASSLDQTDQNECLNNAENFDAEELEDDVANLYTDNCGATVSADLTGTTPGTNNSDCNWSFTYTFTITDGCNITTANVVRSGGDNTDPEITCPANTSFTSVGGSYPTPVNTGNATATDNCGTPDIGYFDVVSGCTPNSTTYTINRTFTADDGCGNTDECTQTIIVNRTVATNCFTASLLNRNFDGTNTTFIFRACALGCKYALSYIAFVTATNIPVVSPVNGSYYPSIANPKYKVSVPVGTVKKGKTLTTVWGIKFDVNTGEGIKARGQCDDFTFTLKGDVPANAITVQFKAGSGQPENATATCPTGGSGSNASSSPVTYETSVVEQNLISQLSLKAFPNPYTDKVRFTVESAASGQGSLEVFNVLGQKVKTVHQGTFISGTQSFDLNVPGSHRSTLIYVLRIGDKMITGKISSVNR